MPSVKNIWTEPQPYIIRDAPLVADSGVYQADILVSGMLCGSLCAGNVRRSLERVPGVEGIRYFPEEDRFLVTYRARAQQTDALRMAVLRAVWFRPLRALLARLRPLRRSQSGAEEEAERRHYPCGDLGGARWV